MKGSDCVKKLGVFIFVFCIGILPVLMLTSGYFLSAIKINCVHWLPLLVLGGGLVASIGATYDLYVFLIKYTV